MTAEPLGAWVAADFELVADLDDLMATGVTAADSGRVFVSVPRWGDPVPYTVAEIVDGKPVPYPSRQVNDELLVSVQSVVIGPDGHLWALDTGSLAFAPWIDGGPKLVEVDLDTDTVLRVIRPRTEALTPTSYLNDVRFDLSKGAGGYAYLTDSQAEGALVVIDLATGDTWAKLRGHPSTHAEDGFRAIVQGVVREGELYNGGADGIAISATSDRLYYCPLASRRLYSVPTAALRDRDLGDDKVAQQIVDHGDKGASDGLETDASGNVYVTAYEHSAVLKLATDGSWSTVLNTPGALWPDTLAVAADGNLYVSLNQLPRTPLFNHDVDDRIPPYQIIRIPVDAAPVRLS
ncbi:L-dopachrome tautomerase-related protein [Asanoa siamensis]|uniref:Sugar lactone lactonase YvrE n=1 Tax=Asanoa siamensis TaxID=926357 RepID=A0ABQ4D300_9ACTN|nr:L-dopachrome tautomerase-related protein [Asanoa siamensis]GIF77915.1 hypothetical protein Asi02nite_74330 [Asanoa siamensis]